MDVLHEDKKKVWFTEKMKARLFFFWLVIILIFGAGCSQQYM